MALTREVLHEDQWLSLMKVVDEENHVSGYVYSHETRCNGHIVSILPFRRHHDGISYLLRSEVTPCWGMEPSLSSVTGGVDEGDTPLSCAIKELEEETGYVAPLIDLGTCRGTKSTDTVYHLYAADVNGLTPGIARGDGTFHDTNAGCVWVRDVSKGVDPLAAMCVLRLAAKQL